MDLTNGKIQKEVSRKEEIKSDPVYQSVCVADLDAFNNYQGETLQKKEKYGELEFLQSLKKYLDLIAFPILRNNLIEQFKNITNDISLITFLENIPNKEYFNKKEIIQILEKK